MNTCCSFETTTTSGLAATVHEIKPFNSANQVVSCPLKGEVWVKKPVPGSRKVKTADGDRWPLFTIWSIDGRKFFQEPNEHDIIVTDEMREMYENLLEEHPGEQR